MRRKPGALTEHESHLIKIAWWVSFLATIAIVAILGMVRSAQAATLSLGDPGAALASLQFETAAEEPDDDGEDTAEGEDEEERGAKGCEGRPPPCRQHPRSCHNLFDRELTVRRTSPVGLVFRSLPG